MNKKWLVLLMALIMVTSLLAGCTEKQEVVETDKVEVVEEVSFPLMIVDGLGNEVTIEKKPEKIVSIAPSQTEILFALGLENRIIAVSDYCDYPVAALEKEKVGSSWTTNTERIIELEPDLVFVYGEGQPEAMEQLAAVGITIVRYMPETVDAIFETISATGKITGEEAAAAKLVKEMEEKRDAIVNKLKDQPKVKVFYQVWDEPLMTAGPGSFIDELIQLAGGENIAADAEGAWPMYSVEALVEKNPEVFLAPAHVGENMNLTAEEQVVLIDTIKARPGFDQISAVINNRVELLEPNIVSRPGARIIDALELLAKTIHPELF